MHFHIITLFPEMIKAVLGESIIGRGEKKGFIKIDYHQLRDHSDNKHKTVDDTLYGGGMGMLLTAAPIYNCYQKICENIAGDSSADIMQKKTRTIYMSPKGCLLTQKKAEELLAYTDLIIVCGHYEGVDERLIEKIADEEISIGDYVLTGGELPCAILADCVARLVPGVLSDPECHQKESISSGLLEYPQYTKPFEFMGQTVPEVLISGHHAKIEEWRHWQSILLTAARRPDLFEAWLEKNLGKLSKSDLKFLRENDLLGDRSDLL
ncbi:MAG: tRNA (guanosine(37)-N1)-methyltransferase TrmD [Oscillospiraceae bacterium]|nr:tRNA (guanosine(37)-N1)-methyltransferase TrmD [Oscillospiraceae bacterium]